MTTNGVLVNGTDLTRYDRTLDLESYGQFLNAIEYRISNVVLPGMPGEVYGVPTGGTPAAAGKDVSLLLELTGNTAANTWASTHAQMVTDFHTNLATLKTLTAVTSTPLTLTVVATGTTTLAYRTGLAVAYRAEFWADVTLSFRLIEGTV